MAIVAFLPTADAPHPLADRGLSPTPCVITAPAPGARWVAHVSAALAGTAEPLVLVFHGEQCAYAPAVGFSRRSLRRPAVGYVLVDPVLPQVGGEYGDWPDAPVVVVLTPDASPAEHDAALQAQLRGWQSTSAPLADVLASLA